MAGANLSGGRSDWLASETTQHGLSRYISTLRERWWLVALCTAVALGGALLYVKTTDKVYEASADLLVSPVSNDDDTTLGLGLIRDSSDPTRDVSTAARYVESIPVARRVKGALHLSDRPADLLGRVTAEPLAQSSIVTITAQAPTPRGAAAVANAFAAQTVRLRTDQLRQQLDLTIPALRQRVAQLPQSERAATNGLPARLAALEALRGVPDPTIRVATPAVPPDKPSKPRPALSIAAGLLIGLILGLGGAFALHALDPRLRREEQLRAIYRVPILARIPAEPRSHRDGALAPERVSGGVSEAYRTLRAGLAASRGASMRNGSILVTGSSPGEGKTTTAINLAHSLVQAGNKVILIEADAHRPMVGRTLGVEPTYGLASVLIRQVSLADALVTSERYGPDLLLLLVERPGLGTADRLSLPTARQLVAEAEEMADFVVIDSPPLTEVIDALPFVHEAANVLIVARLGRTKVPKLVELGEILQRDGVEPAGVALVGVERNRQGYYYRFDEDSRASSERLATR
jgi:Mrp family chromosome partitioning ATPase/capsular polysaccharide biosynthesis protein